MKRVLRGVRKRHPQRFFVTGVNPIVLPESVPLERSVPEAIVAAYDGRLERFDYKALFYDVVRAGKRLELLGPPLRNLKDPLEAATWRIGETTIRPVLADDVLTQLSYIAKAGTRLTIDAGDWTSSTATSSARDGRVFAGRNCLLTMNKNNPLEWISDWVTYYRKQHAVDAVLIYDNNSTFYTKDELLETIRRVNGIDVAAVVDWPFKYGPHWERPGVEWRAQYSQVTMFKHARLRFLHSANAMINVDIDEYAFSPAGHTLPELLAAQPTGALLFQGRWIEDVPTGGRLPRARDFSFRRIEPRPLALDKWAIAPTRLRRKAGLSIHSIRGVRQATREMHFWHFRGLNTRWKYERDQVADYDPQIHEKDPLLIETMRKVFPRGWRERLRGMFARQGRGRGRAREIAAPGKSGD